MKFVGTLLFLIISAASAFAQPVSALPFARSAQFNATAVYSTVTGELMMVVVDANNLSDPSFNPPNSAQIAIPIATFNSLDATQFKTYLSNAIPSPAQAAGGD